MPDPTPRYILDGAIAVILAVFAAGFFELNLGDSEVLTMFLTVVACGYVAARDRVPSQGAESPEITAPES